MSEIVAAYLAIGFVFGVILFMELEFHQALGVMFFYPLLILFFAVKGAWELVSR